MRIDVKNLLNRLGKQDFAYKEFEDRFSELELWPLLEALLRDPRMHAFDQTQSFASAPYPAQGPLAGPSAGGATPSHPPAMATKQEASPQAYANAQGTQPRTAAPELRQGLAPSAEANSLFSRYAESPSSLIDNVMDHAGAAEQGRDVRSMLRQWSEGQLSTSSTTSVQFSGSQGGN